MTKVSVAVPATTANLGPGFDALGMALDVWNRFEFEFDEVSSAKDGEPSVVVRCEGEGADELPTDARNLVYKAFVQGLGSMPPPARTSITIRNEVPLASGLGSSATAIVGGLAAAFALRGEEGAERAIVDLATQVEGHPDNVAPAVWGGLVVSVFGSDGQVTSVPVAPPSDLKVCVAVPDFYLDTRQSRARLPHRYSRHDAVFNLSRAALWVAAAATGNLDVLNVATQDVLHQPYREALIPGLDDVFQSALSAGALGVALSGAGPSVAAFCREESMEAVGEGMRRTFRKVGVTARIVHTQPSSQGVQIDLSHSPAAVGRVRD